MMSADPAVEVRTDADARPVAQRTSSRLRWVLYFVVIVATLSVAAAAAVYVEVYRPARKVDASVHAQVLDAATRGTVAALSYTSATWDSDLSAAKTYLTGDFLTYYSRFADQFVAPAVKEKNITTKASIIKAAVTEVQPQRAVVLVFVDQITSTSDVTEPAPSSSSVMVTLLRGAEGTWRIAEFKPI